MYVTIMFNHLSYTLSNKTVRLTVYYLFFIFQSAAEYQSTGIPYNTRLLQLVILLTNYYIEFVKLLSKVTQRD